LWPYFYYPANHAGKPGQKYFLREKTADIGAKIFKIRFFRRFCRPFTFKRSFLQRFDG
jgi:hypothetical protein